MRAGTEGIVCRSCGTNQPAGTTFCSDCGDPLVPSRPCAGCQTLNPEAYSFCIKCGQALDEPAPAAPKEILFTLASGRYQTVRLLGEGAKKRVYLARDTELDRDVAVGMIKTDLIDAEGHTRFWREAKAMGRLGDHPNLVTMYDVGEEDSTPYIVSQYLPGGSVADLLAREPQRRLDVRHALDIAAQIARALAHAHARGIIHRDVKPGNVWLTEEGVCKLGDFGLAVVGDRSRLTAEGLMVGTANYMAPEQAVGRDVDARSDLYALGALLYELVCGRPPFLGDDAVAVVFQHINTAPVAPSWHNPQVPHGVEVLITALLAKPPEDRPGSAAEVDEALRALTEQSISRDRVAPVHVNPLDRLAAGVFVGRDKELEQLRGALDATFSGSGRLILLAGEPGIGKTRTAEELVTYARLRNAKVLLGRCYEGEGAPAYWPWMQAIRSYVHDVDSKTLAAEMGSGAAHIAKVVSDVRERLPDVPEAPTLEPEQARFQLFDSITSFFKNASAATPIVLVLDDLHWADKSSLLLLEFFARELRDIRVLVIGTYREEELGRQHPLSQALGDLSRERLSQRVLLRGLTQADLAHFIELSAGISPSEDLVEDVYAQTDGNPFFVGEIVRLLVAEGRLEQRVRTDRSWSVPQSIREVIGRRLDRLSPRCNAVLSVAAVVGRDFDLKVLQQATDEHDVLDVLEEALDARIIGEVPEKIGRYRFSHALIKDTLYEELRTARRIAAHHKVGEALETLYKKDVDARAAELAHHFLEAASVGDLDKAISYAARAGAHTASHLAYEESVRHFARALNALDLKEGEDDDLRGELLLSLGDAQWRAGDGSASRNTFKRAAEAARRLKDGHKLARAALGYGGGVGRFGLQELADPALVELLEQALESLGEDGPLRARLLARLAVELYYSDSVERRLALSEEAVERARRHGDKSAELVALYSLHWSTLGPDRLEERLATSAEIALLAHEIGDKEMAFRGHHLRLISVLEVGDLEAVDAELEACRQLATEMRQPIYVRQVKRLEAMKALLHGDFEVSERLASEVGGGDTNRIDQVALFSYGARMGVQYWAQGRLDELLAAARTLAQQNPWNPTWRVTVAFIASELGREAEARAEFESFAGDDFRSIPRDSGWFGALYLLSLVCASLDDAHRAPILYDLLLPYQDRITVLAAGAASLGSVATVLGILAFTMERHDDAAVHFDSALEHNRAIDAKPLIALTQYWYARMLVDRGGTGDRDTARRLLDEAVDLTQKLGMKRLMQHALELKMESASSESPVRVDELPGM